MSTSRPTTVGATRPPSCPREFIVPETVPPWRPPMSRQVAQQTARIRSAAPKLSARAEIPIAFPFAVAAIVREKGRGQQPGHSRPINDHELMEVSSTPPSVRFSVDSGGPGKRRPGDLLRRQAPPVVTTLLRGRTRSTAVHAPAEPGHAPSPAAERTVRTFEQVHPHRLMGSRPQLHELL